MPRAVFFVALAGVLVLPALAAPCVWAGGDLSIAPFARPIYTRLRHGEIRALDLFAGALRLGRAKAFFGVDSLSDGDHQYLTSGVRWSLGAPDRPLLGVTALQTEARGSAAGFSGQQLLRVQNQIDLGRNRYLPQLRTRVYRVRDTDQQAALGSFAARVGLSETLGGAEYSLSYIDADTDFNALGSSIDAGERGLVLNSRYHLGRDWALSHDLRLDRRHGAAGPARLVQRWVLSPAPDIERIGRQWRLSADLGDASALPGEPTRLAIELTAATARWRAWRVDTSLGWYQGAMPAPRDLPVAGTLWRVSASRSLRIAGFDAVVSPNFALGGSRYRRDRYGGRAGLTLRLSKLGDTLGFNVNYRSAAWCADPASELGDFRLSLRYTRSAGSILSALAGAAHTLRLPWQRRYH